MEGRRRVTLYDQMTATETSSRNSLAGLFLNDVVLSSQKTDTAAAGNCELSRNRTLSDIIREDEPNNTKDRMSWKAFKDKLLLKAWTSSVHIPIPIQNNNNKADLSRFSVSSQTRLDSDESTQHNIALQQQNDVVENPDSSDLVQSSHQSSSRFVPPVDAPIAGGDEAAAAELVSVSLMDLLEETEADLDRMNDDEDGVDEYEEEREEEEEMEGEKGSVNCVVEYNCCVCMVRHKGAAFIPCGHTFCRKCSRELWVSRGNCPLCNHFILEILDIF